MEEAKEKVTRKATKKKDTNETIKVKQVKSAIRRPKDQMATLIGLGLNKLHKVKELKDTPEVRGMIRKVSHLVEVVE